MPFRPLSSGPVAGWRPCSSILLLAGWFSILNAGCGDREAGSKAEAVAPLRVVDVTTVTQRDVPIYQEWVDTLDGMVNAQIQAQVTGYLIRRHYEEGQLVKKGQLLYEIDPRTFQAALEGATSILAREEAKVTLAKLDLQRIQRLLPDRAGPGRQRRGGGAEGKSRHPFGRTEAELHQNPFAHYRDHWPIQRTDR